MKSLPKPSTQFVFLAVILSLRISQAAHYAAPNSRQQHLNKNVVSLFKQQVDSSSKKRSYHEFVTELKKKPKQSTQLLFIRGGSSSPVIETEKVLSFVQNLSGQVFCFSCVIYGLACSIAPKGCAKLFYGVTLENNYKEKNGRKKTLVKEQSLSSSCSIIERNRIVFLMKLIGCITLGIGLTASFAIAVNLNTMKFFRKGNSLFYQAIGIGLLPRFLFLLHLLMVQPRNISSLGSTIVTGVDVWIFFIETVLFLLSVFQFSNAITPDFPILFETILCFLLGPILFFRPKLLFDTTTTDQQQQVSKHEKLLTRLVATYLLSAAVLVSALQLLGTNQNKLTTTTAIESVGFTALIWVAALFHITFVRKDVLDCQCSFTAHVVMMGIGLAVASGGLWSFFQK